MSSGGGQRSHPVDGVLLLRHSYIADLDLGLLCVVNKPVLLFPTIIVVVPNLEAGTLMSRAATLMHGFCFFVSYKQQSYDIMGLIMSFSFLDIIV